MKISPEMESVFRDRIGDQTPRKANSHDDEPPPVTGPEDYGFHGHASGNAEQQQPTAPPIQWLDMSNWDNEPRPEREWAILDRVPV